MSVESSVSDQSGIGNRTGLMQPVPAGFPVGIALRVGGMVDHPITLIQTLGFWGLGLRKAHEAISRLVSGETVPVRLTNAPEPPEVIQTLGKLGIAVDAVETAMAAEARARHAEFCQPQ